MPDRAEESILFHVKQSKTAPKKQPMEDKTMAVTFLTKDNFKSEVMQADKPVLIDFTQTGAVRARWSPRSWTRSPASAAT